MFERFTPAARQVVKQAVADSHRMRHCHVGTEHLVLALLAGEGTVSQQVLTRHGLTRDGVAEAVLAERGTDELDAEALEAVGIDLDDVRVKVEAAFGPGALDRPPDARRRRGGRHVPFTRPAKKVLELALREALALKHDDIGDGHILLGLLREHDGLAAKVIRDRGVDARALRHEVTAALAPARGEAS